MGVVVAGCIVIGGVGVVDWGGGGGGGTEVGTEGGTGDISDGAVGVEGIVVVVVDVDVDVDVVVGLLLTLFAFFFFVCFISGVLFDVSWWCKMGLAPVCQTSIFFFFFVVVVVVVTVSLN